jgi:hypothetical protein
VRVESSSGVEPFLDAQSRPEKSWALQVHERVNKSAKQQ